MFENVNVGKRKISLNPAANAALSSLPPFEQRRVIRSLKLLSYPASVRPQKLAVFQSKDLPSHFIVRISDSIRLIYHKTSKYQIVVDDIFRRPSIKGLYVERSRVK